MITDFYTGHSSLGLTESILGEHNIMHKHMNAQNIKWNDLYYKKNIV